MLLEDLNLNNMRKNSVVRVSEVADVMYNFRVLAVKENEILFATC